MPSYRYASKQNYACADRPTADDLQAGALMRIADKMEGRNNDDIIAAIKRSTAFQEEYYRGLLAADRQQKYLEKNFIIRTIKMFGWTLTISKPKP